MSKQFYVDRKFNASSRELIETMNGIVDEYVEQDFRLTVRQLYYQMVARGYIENTERSYGRICSIVNDAKLAGMMDWDAIEDRTRAFIRRTRWKDGAEILNASARGFHMDMWSNQRHRVFCIVEKEALAGVLEGVCNAWDVPLLAARGYPSGTVLREFAISDLQPAMGFDNEGQPLPGHSGEKLRQNFMILHLGDHDPSGIDMSRDLSERLHMFAVGTGFGKALGPALFKRIALNMNQIEEQKPPENPAKTSDSRFKSYQDQFGESSWELDALKPDYLARLVQRHIRQYIDDAAWDDRKKQIEKIRARIDKVAVEFS